MLDLEKGLPETGDREPSSRWMMNVVANAIKYTPDGGRIKISAGRERGRVWMECQHNGTAFPRRTAPVFERFYRVDESRSRESPGHGLGPLHRAR